MCVSTTKYTSSHTSTFPSENALRVYNIYTGFFNFWVQSHGSAHLVLYILCVWVYKQYVVHVSRCSDFFFYMLKCCNFSNNVTMILNWVWTFLYTCLMYWYIKFVGVSPRTRTMINKSGNIFEMYYIIFDITKMLRKCYKCDIYLNDYSSRIICPQCKNKSSINILVYLFEKMES